MIEIDRLKDLDWHFFLQNYLKYNQPVIINKNINNWPAITKWSALYFSNVLPDTSVTIGYKNLHEDVTGNKRYVVTHQQSTFSQAIEVFAKPSTASSSYFLLPKCLGRDLKLLLEDIHPYWQVPKYNLSLWMAGQHYIRSLHYDRSHGLLNHISGSKLVILYPPTATKFLYPNTKLTKYIDPQIPTADYYQASQIVDVLHVNLNKFPMFKYAQPYTVELMPGDTLFIPAGWWHEIRYLTPAISVGCSCPVKPDECDLSHVLKYIAWDYLENDNFEAIDDIVNLNDYKNYLELAEMLYQQKSYWLSLCFSIGYLREMIKNSLTNKHNDGINMLDWKIVSAISNKVDTKFKQVLIQYTADLPKIIIHKNENNHFADRNLIAKLFKNIATITS